MSLLTEIVKYTAPPRRKEGEFTIKDYQDEVVRQGFGRVSYSKAKATLDTLVAEGKLRERSVLEEGHWATVYRGVEDVGDQPGEESGTS